MLIFFSSIIPYFALKKDSSENDKRIFPKELKVNTEKLSSDIIEPVEFIKYGNTIIDAKTVSPEMLSIIFMTNNKFDALYTSRGKTATIENATGIGPLLTSTKDLIRFIRANPQYKDLNETIDAKKGINHNGFLKVWNTYDTPEKRTELISNIVKFFWAEKFQPTFDKMAEKGGYQHITYDNYDEPENFALSMSVISCLGQSSRTADIFIESKKEVDAAVGKKATDGDYIEKSYEKRYNLWKHIPGIRERYYGKNGEIGEIELNRQIRKLVKNRKQLREDKKKTINDVKTVYLQNLIDSTIVNNHDTIKLPEAVSKSLEDVRTDKKDKDIVFSEKNGKKELKEEKEKFTIPEYKGNSSYLGELFEQRNSLQKQIENDLAYIEDISKEEYTIMGRKIIVDYNNFTPVNALQIYEAALDPGMLALDRNAIGKYQFDFRYSAVKGFINYAAEDFPELKEALKGGKNKIIEVWQQIAQDPKKKDLFSLRQDDYAWEKLFKKPFETYHKKYGAPEITKADLLNPDCENFAYAAAVASILIQRPASAPIFTKEAYKNQMAKNTKYGIDNEAGLKIYDIRAKKMRRFKKRLLGTRKMKGEKDIVENSLRYKQEKSRIMARVQENVEKMQVINFAINVFKNENKNSNANVLAQNSSNNDIRAMEKKQKVGRIQRYMNLFKEMKFARNLVERNKTKEPEPTDKYLALRNNDMLERKDINRRS